MKRMGIFVGVLAGCIITLSGLNVPAQEVYYSAVAGTDFTKYKTYKWVQVPNVRYPAPNLDGQIKAAIDSQLAQKGLTRSDDDAADLYVAYQVSIDQQTQWTAYGTGAGGWGGSSAQTTSSAIKVGTLVLDLYDVAAKQQVWRGDATKTLNPSKDPQKNQEKLQKAMAKLLKNYPPPVK